MAEVTWVKGSISPLSSGKYYIILEAQKDIADFKKGDIEITEDYYYVDIDEFETLGKNNEYWKVLAWADMVKPDVPDFAKKKLKVYFDMPVSDEWRNQ